MDFSYTEEESEVADLARKILEDKVSHETLTALEAGPGPRYDADLYQALATANLLGIGLPESVGGSGLGLLAQSLVITEIGRTLAPVPYIASIATSADALAHYGTPAQIDAWVRPAIEGTKILAPAISEPFNLDQLDPATTAAPEGDGWRINGTKTTVPAATIADVLIVTASINGRPAAFLVDPAADGVTITAQDTTTHEPYGYVELDGVVVGADAVVGGDVSKGHEVVAHLLERATLALCAMQLGVTDAAMRHTAEYTKQRVQFERAIGTFQAVGHRLADCYIEVEGIRMTLWQAIFSIDAGREATMDVQTAKFWAAEGGHRVAHAIVHLHGGMGIATEYLIHRYFSFAKQIEFSLGSAYEQTRRIGATLAASPV